MNPNKHLDSFKDFMGDQDFSSDEEDKLSPKHSFSKLLKMQADQSPIYAEPINQVH